MVFFNHHKKLWQFGTRHLEKTEMLLQYRICMSFKWNDVRPWIINVPHCICKIPAKHLVKGNGLFGFFSKQEFSNVSLVKLVVWKEHFEISKMVIMVHFWPRLTNPTKILEKLLV